MVNPLVTPVVNPGDIVTVMDFSAETLRDMVAHLEVSRSFEELVYREAELDAIWSITGFALENVQGSELRESVSRLHEAAHQAHDLTAAGRPREAAAILRPLVDGLEP